MKRVAVIATILLTITLGGLWYVALGTPQYSLYRLKVAFEENDLDTVERFIDIDAVADSAVDIMMEEIREQSQEGLKDNPFVGLAEAIIAMMEPQLRRIAKDKMRQGMREGLQIGDKEPSTWSRAKLQSIERQGKVAEARLTLDDGTLRLTMRQAPDRHWRIVAIPSLADWLQEAHERADEGEE